MLKKINRGIILTVAVCIAVIIYIVAVAFLRAVELQNIEKVVKSFIEVEAACYLLPESCRTEGQSLSDAELEALIQNNEKSIDSFFAEDVYESKYIKELCAGQLRAQNSDPGKIIYGYEKHFINTEYSQFSGDQVQLEVRTRYTVKSAEHNGSFDSFDIYILKKSEGEWKLVYMYPGNEIIFSAADNMKTYYDYGY